MFKDDRVSMTILVVETLAALSLPKGPWQFLAIALVVLTVLGFGLYVNADYLVKERNKPAK